MSYTIKSVGQRIYVKRLSREEIRGIRLPVETQKRSKVGQVIHIGPDCTWMKEGDIILFAQYSGVQIPTDGNYIESDKYEDTLVMNEEDILGILVPNQSISTNGEKPQADKPSADKTQPQIQEV